ncbi:hypothetical protein OUZ56_016594 [Daphnia magna]|uniref:Uncharacterized protein n=1 Tax=Daphnia magna TaxID=35525 RepID=A0ABR0AR25_9CRUS|nr:hypothetical protein OUZ56_016594 [Daphnia magna]
MSEPNYCHGHADREKVFTSPHYLMVMLTKPLAESVQRRRRLAHIHYPTGPDQTGTTVERDSPSFSCHQHLRPDYDYTT